LPIFSQDAEFNEAILDVSWLHFTIRIFADSSITDRFTSTNFSFDWWHCQCYVLYSWLDCFHVRVFWVWWSGRVKQIF